MKFYCMYCDCIIEAITAGTCPNCGAPSGKIKQEPTTAVEHGGSLTLAGQVWGGSIFVGYDPIECTIWTDNAGVFELK